MMDCRGGGADTCWPKVVVVEYSATSDSVFIKYSIQIPLGCVYMIYDRNHIFNGFHSNHTFL